eukprot:CAMPEP_0172780310 /NCGR_PEP_ID=MMETSP1074-20121228/202861_1 /TAXON_ID=2916 /ORGANISM="Ceratium fusus, Strain PA161109" /LENGTH=527 /DNA_ID=CAMNT_0013617285 /DNA_START=114 /DNA_END=1697 /DNA_ORIENTATION=+
MSRWVVLYGSFLVLAANLKDMPVLYGELEASLHLDSTQLGIATGVQGLCHVIAVCFFGYLTSKASSRLVLLAACAAAWATGTLLNSFARGALMLVLSRAVLGLSSGVVGPVSQCLVAEWTQPADRAQAFGVVVAADAVGQGLAAAGLAWMISMAGSWRLPLVAVAALTAAFSAGAWAVAAQESPGQKQQHVTRAPFSRQVAAVFHTPSMLAIILQGFFASTTLQANAFLCLWLQHCGYGAFESAWLYSSVTMGNLLGCLLAGNLSDRFAVRWKLYGRIVFGQCGEAARVPALCSLLWAGPRGAVPLTMLCCFAYGLLQNWNYVGAVKPLCTEAIPPHLIGTAIAIAATVDGAFAAAAGGPLVGYAAQHIFGYTGGAITEQNCMALQAAMGGLLVVTSTCTLCCCTVLYWTFPHDRHNALVSGTLQQALLESALTPPSTLLHMPAELQVPAAHDMCASQPVMHDVSSPGGSTAASTPERPAKRQVVAPLYISVDVAGATPEKPSPPSRRLRLHRSDPTPIPSKLFCHA